MLRIARDSSAYFTTFFTVGETLNGLLEAEADAISHLHAPMRQKASREESPADHARVGLKDVLVKGLGANKRTFTLELRCVRM
jgi:hypothetical protein